MLTPFSVADTLDTRRLTGFISLVSSGMVRISPVQVTMVLDGVVVVLHPRRPALVAAFSVGVFWAYSVAKEGAGWMRMGAASAAIDAIDLVIA